MKHKSAAILFALVTLILFSVASRGFTDEPEVVEVEGGQARVTLSKPFRFDPEVDADDWVRWNQMRDQMP